MRQGLGVGPGPPVDRAKVRLTPVGLRRPTRGRWLHRTLITRTRVTPIAAKCMDLHAEPDADRPPQSVTTSLKEQLTVVRQTGRHLLPLAWFHDRGDG